jgi:hypothetical protein
MIDGTFYMILTAGLLTYTLAASILLVHSIRAYRRAKRGE